MCAEAWTGDHVVGLSAVIRRVKRNGEKLCAMDSILDHCAALRLRLRPQALLFKRLRLCLSSQELPPIPPLGPLGTSVQSNSFPEALSSTVFPNQYNHLVG